jgi:hypothetical protein
MYRSSVRVGSAAAHCTDNAMKCQVTHVHMSMTVLLNALQFVVQLHVIYCYLKISADLHVNLFCEPIQCVYCCFPTACMMLGCTSAASSA